MKRMWIVVVFAMGCGKSSGGVSVKDAKKTALAAVRAGDFAKLEPLLWSPDRVPAACRRDGDKEKAAALRATTKENLAACKALDWDAANVLLDEGGELGGQILDGVPEGCKMMRVSDVEMVLELGKEEWEIRALHDAFEVGGRVLMIAPPTCKRPDAVAEWLEKLKTEVSFDEAVAALGSLKDPRAIAPLTAAWKAYGRPAPVLRAIVQIGAATGWEQVTPLLIEHISTFDETVPTDVGQALMACEALGAAGAKEAVPALTAIAEEKYEPGSPGEQVQKAARAALEHLR